MEQEELERSRKSTQDGQELLEWVAMPRTALSLPPLGAIQGGYTEEGEATYVARSHLYPQTYRSDKACGAYIPSLKLASIPYAGGDALCKNCDVLVCRDPEILYWMDASNGSIPDLAVGIGNDRTEEIFVARTRPYSKLIGLKTADGKKMRIDKLFKGPMLGKLHPSHGTMYLAFKHSEYLAYDYQVLCAYRPPAVKHVIASPHVWVSASNGYLPESSLVGGLTGSGECTYIARVRHGAGYPLQVGFVEPSRKVCHYSWQGKAYSTGDYEVFVPMNPKDFTWKLSSAVDFVANDVNVVLVDNNAHACAIGRTEPGVVFQIGMRSGKTWMGSSIVDEIDPNNTNHKMQIVGSVHRSSKFLCIPYEGKDFMFDSYETLVVSPVPNTLLELCRYALLTYTSAVPERINKLPLPEKMKLFCQLREKEV